MLAQIRPVRDEVDMRVVKSVHDGNGRVINSQDEVVGGLRGRGVCR